METNAVFLQQVGVMLNKDGTSESFMSNVTSQVGKEQASKNGETYQPQYHLIKICRDRNWMSMNSNPISICQAGIALPNSLAKLQKNVLGNIPFPKQIPDSRKPHPYEAFLMPADKDEHDPLDLTLNAQSSSTPTESSVVTQEIIKRCSQNEFESGSQQSQDVLQTITNNCFQQIVQNANFEEMKRRGRKRKYIFNDSFEDIDLNVCNPCLGSDNASRQAGKQAEVLVAAKSLFSKRTRTLYHWIHPEMSKTQIKADVNAAWDILPVEQREFYISQVLGRFGFPQCSLMVNPQLRKLPNDETTSSQSENDETKDAVSSLILSEKRDDWQNYARPNRKKKRYSRSSTKTNTFPNDSCENDTLNKTLGNEENVLDDFHDDPELSREFEQFRWTLHLNGAHENN